MRGWPAVCPRAGAPSLRRSLAGGAARRSPARSLLALFEELGAVQDGEAPRWRSLSAR